MYMQYCTMRCDMMRCDAQIGAIRYNSMSPPPPPKCDAMLLRHAGRPVDGLIPPSVHITAEFVLIMLDGRPYRPSASCRMRSIACEDTATTSYPYPLQVPPPTRQGLIDWRHIRSQSPSVTRRTCDLQRAAGRSRMRAVPCLARFPVAHGTKMNDKAVAQPVPVGDVDCPSCVWVWVCHALVSHVPSISNHHLTFLSLFCSAFVLGLGG